MLCVDLAVAWLGVCEIKLILATDVSIVSSPTVYNYNEFQHLVCHTKGLS